jgi:hypothetical protein
MSFGYELERLDPANGRHLWTSAPRISRTAFDDKAVAFDQTAIYYGTGKVLQATSLSDGKRLWEQPLPASGGRWRVVRTESTVAVYARPQWARVWARAACQVPVGLTQISLPLPRFSDTLPDSARGFTILLHDPKDGQLVQRLNFTTVQPWASAAWLQRGVMVGAEDRAWCLRAASD